MSLYRKIGKRSREQSVRKTEKMSNNSSAGAFRRYPISLGPDDCGVFYPMTDSKGEFVEDDLLGHKVDGWDRACTANLEGYEGLCCYCDVGTPVIPDHDGDGVQTAVFKMIGVWDMNYWVPKIGKDGRKLKSREIYLLGPNESPPEDAEYGGPRYFKMGLNRVNSFYTYAGELEDVCQCVKNTNDPRISRCFVTEIRCPRCGLVLYSDQELARYRKPQQIRNKILDTLHKCDAESDGGCWTYEDESKGLDAMFLPDPVFSCENHLHGGDCTGARPCHPYLGPALVTRVGEGVGTTYEWERDDSLDWSEWVDFDLEDDALEAFKDGMDFSDRMGMKKTLVEQAKELEIEYPYEPQTRSYGPRRRPRKDDSQQQQQRPQRSRPGRENRENGGERRKRSSRRRS